MKHLFRQLNIANSILLIVLFFANSHAYAEEFVTFAKGYAKDNSQFQIEMPSLSSSKLDKINAADIINNNIVFNVFNFQQLSEVLDNATGGEIIVVRSNLRDKRYHYKQKRRFNAPVLILGMLGQNRAPFLENITWENLHNVTISHFKVSNLWDTARNNYSWQIRNSNNVRLSNLHFSDKNNNLVALKRGKLDTILASQSGLLIKQSNNIIIDRTLFTDLFHGVEFHDMNGFYAVANKAVRVASDMFSGGGVNNALFDSNLMHTRTPVFYKQRFRKTQYVHSDMIQLYTSKQKRNNTNITIRNNVSLVGKTPLRNPNLTGWQCFFTRDEKGDSFFGRFRSLPYANIKIINNFCASNQHHGVTLSRGIDNVVAGNFVLLVDQVKNKRQATGSIKVFENKNCRILGNVSNEFEFKNMSNCQITNNINGFKPDYNNIIFNMREAIHSAPQRAAIEVASSSNDLSRFYTNTGLQENPLQYLDYSKLTLVPVF
ncbi:hypothetical protein GCM10009133_16990 [Cocleimonas flava]|uniref:Right handed beta helix region n=1 Tax=Cocleimonas flava TaxID=634765 RepID=A0A4V2P871_9GAMM|nr:hypothetical protein [Cocleimonas flava]TCJ84625.1 hypothetical protein EV695_2584 [Cocleimonas flava]